MSTIQVTATVTFTYNTADGLVTTMEEGIEDIVSTLPTLASSDFEITATQTEPKMPWAGEGDDSPDAAALSAIAGLLSASEWSADTLDAVADLVRATGREIRDVGVDTQTERTPGP